MLPFFKTTVTITDAKYVNIRVVDHRSRRFPVPVSTSQNGEIGSNGNIPERANLDNIANKHTE